MKKERFKRIYQQLEVQKKCAKVLGGIVIAVIIIIPLVIQLCPTFGGVSTSEDRKQYAQKAENYVNWKFRNEKDKQLSMKTNDKESNEDETTGKGVSPVDELPVERPNFYKSPMKDEFSVTWYGHSTLIMQMSGLNIAIDPVFSKMASPVPLFGTKRFSPLKMEVEDLPDIDICLLTHDHYDHLDYSTIKKMSKKVKLFIVPLGVENHLQNWGVETKKIKSLAWWEKTRKKNLTIVCTPARHFSGRKLIDGNETLWCSWVLMNDSLKVFDSGDTGYGSHFERIKKEYGDFDLSFINAGQYKENCHDVHLFPEEAIQAAKDLGTKAVMPIHWGAFVYSDHAWDDPAARMVKSGEENGLTVITPKLGQTVKWQNYLLYQERWWEHYD